MNIPKKLTKHLNLQDQFKNKIVRIKNALTGGYLITNHNGNAFWINEASPESYWIVYPLSGGKYVFANLTYGMVLQFTGQKNLSYVTTKNSYDGSSSQQWTLETMEDNLNYYHIRHLDSGFLLYGSQIQDSAVQNVYEIYGTSEEKDEIANNGDNVDKIKWSFEIVGDLDVAETPSLETLDIVPQYTDPSLNLPATTPDRLISYTLLPAPMVKDNTLSLQQKLTTSPYYIMEKHQYWTKLQDLSLAPGERKEKEYTYGIDDSTQKDMSEKTSITINQDAGFSFSLGGIFGIDASIKKQITNELKVSETQSTHVMQKQSKTSTFDNSGNKYSIFYAKYILTTRLVIKRFSSKYANIAVGDWTFSDENTIQTTSYVTQPPDPGE